MTVQSGAAMAEVQLHRGFLKEERNYDQRVQDMIAGAGGSLIRAFEHGPATIVQFLGSEDAVQRVRAACKALDRNILVTNPVLGMNRTANIGRIVLALADRDTIFPIEHPMTSIIEEKRPRTN